MKVFEYENMDNIYIIYASGLLLLQLNNNVHSVTDGEQKTFEPCSNYSDRHVLSHYYELGNGKTKNIMNLYVNKTSRVQTNLILSSEPFDNNSVVHFEMCNKNNVLILNDTKIIMPSLENGELHTNATTQNYTDTMSLTFKCDDFKNETLIDVHVGIMNATTKQITTYSYSEVTKKFDSSYDKAVVYCLYYAKREFYNMVDIIRHVVTKTQLLYNNSTYDNSDPEGLILNKGEHLYILVFGIITIVILVAVAGTICRNRCRKKNENTTDKVSYVELDIPEHVINMSIKEESPYAQIIGEMKPKSPIKITKL